MARAGTSFSKVELEEALRSLTSTLHKCEKVLPKLRPGTSQHTLLVRRIAALSLSSALIQRELRAVASAGAKAPARQRRGRAPSRA